MLTLVLAVAFAVFISFMCSIMEAALYAVPWSAIEKLRRSGSASGKLLYALRSQVDKPIAAILTLNTIANTAGATIAGGAFLAVYGPEYMALFAAGFTILILAFGEIVPKTLGVAHATGIAQGLARPIHWLAVLLTPAIWLSGLFTRAVSPKSNTPQISEDDICAVAGLSLQAGRIKPYEEHFIRNVLSLDRKHVYEIMTPRTVVFSLPADSTVDEAYQNPGIWHFSRIPVYGEHNEDLLGMVERRQLGQCLAEDRESTKLSAIMRPVHYVQETQTLDLVLREMLKVHVHLFVALDEYGGVAGVVSLEDVLEAILGSEIVDESDTVADMQAYAKDAARLHTTGGNVAK